MGIFTNNNYINANDQNSLWDGIRHNGVLSGLVVSASSPVAMTVEVAAGTAIVNGIYVSINASTPIISAANGTYPRKDIITLNSSGTITVTAGTADQAIPSANTGINTNNPISGNIPSNEIILAEVWVATGATTIVTAAISDKRIFIPYGILVGTLANRPAASSSIRSILYVTQSLAGVTDTVDICLKSVTDTYSWRNITTG